jgi:hypothetical protein
VTAWRTILKRRVGGEAVRLCGVGTYLDRGDAETRRKAQRRSGEDQNLRARRGRRSQSTARGERAGAMASGRLAAPPWERHQVAAGGDGPVQERFHAAHHSRDVHWRDVGWSYLRSWRTPCGSAQNSLAATSGKSDWNSFSTDRLARLAQPPKPRMNPVG